jgi:hypothetical protein
VSTILQPSTIITSTTTTSVSPATTTIGLSRFYISVNGGENGLQYLRASAPNGGRSTLSLTSDYFNSGSIFEISATGLLSDLYGTYFAVPDPNAQNRLFLADAGILGGVPPLTPATCQISGTTLSCSDNGASVFWLCANDSELRLLAPNDSADESGCVLAIVKLGLA